MLLTKKILKLNNKMIKTTKNKFKILNFLNLIMNNKKMVKFSIKLTMSDHIFKT